MAVITLGSPNFNPIVLNPVTVAVSNTSMAVAHGKSVSYDFSESDPIFSAWDKSTGVIIEQSQISPAISITQSQISDGAGLVNLENWSLSEQDDGLVIKYGDDTRTKITKDGDLTSGGILFKTCLVRNTELDNTLNSTDCTLLTISNKVGQVITVDDLPDYEEFDKSGWVAMLSDYSANSGGSDPSPSGNYLYKYFCTVDRVTKTLTFGAVSLTSWYTGAHLVLYNPFLNYTFVTDQTIHPIVNVTGAPAWRALQSYSAPMFRHSDGRFIALVNGWDVAGYNSLGYCYSSDMETWTMGNGDDYVFYPHGVNASWATAQYQGSVGYTNDGTDRLYIFMTVGNSGTGDNECYVLYFDEDLTTFTYSSAIILDEPAGFVTGTPVVIDGVYHLPVLWIAPGDTTGRSFNIFTATSLEGPYTFYQYIGCGSDYMNNDGVAWSYSMGNGILVDDGVKKFGLFDGTSQWSASGTRGKREYSYIEYNEITKIWEISKKGPVILNPLYYYTLNSTYNWAQDHGGSCISIFIDGGDVYACTHFHGTTPAIYQFSLLKLNQSNNNSKVYIPYSGAERSIDLNNKSLVTTGTITAANLSGINTGNQSLAGLVPYTGATGSVNIGANVLTADSVTINASPSNATDAATKGYVDGYVTSGIGWLSPVIDIVANAAALPGGASVADRYITIDNKHIREWNGATWDDITPTSGDTLIVTGDSIAPTNAIGQYTYNGSDWIYSGSGSKHNDTTDKQGGDGTNFYHLSSVINTAVTYVATTTADGVPTGLALSSSGIGTSSSGAQLAYVVLTWDAIATSTFDHYLVEYKRSSFTYYTPLTANTNNITIEGLLPGTSYDFKLASVNKYGTTSAFCAALTITTPIDAVNPDTVASVTATGGIQYVILEWTHNTDYDLASYNIYRNTTNNSAGASYIGNCKTDYFIDGGLTGGTLYYYWIKAVDTSGNLSSAFSTVATTTPRNVIDDDISSVAAIAASKVLIDGTVYLSNWRHASDITKIDGGSIYANSITTTKLNFTPVQSTDVIAKINASAEGIEIDADNFTVSGSTIFTAKVGGTYDSASSGARVRIFPTSDTGIQILDDSGNNVFKAEVGGINVGDITIGNWAGDQGIKYDKSAGTTTFKGAIYASSGSISGVLDFGTSADISTGMNVAIKSSHIWENNVDGGSALSINVWGYNGGNTQPRSTWIGDGQGNYVAGFVPSYIDLKVPVLIGTSASPNANAILEIQSTTKGVILPKLTLSQINSLPNIAGMIAFQSDGGNRFWGNNGAGWRLLD
jgi:hypothetical protein